MTAEPGWRSRHELEAAVAAYEETWWRIDPGVAAILDDPLTYPGVLGRVVDAASHNAVTTATVYRTSDTHTGTPGYVDVRTQTHNGIVRQCVPDLPPHDRPRAFFTIGCPGAGKTTVLRSLVQRYRAGHPAGPGAAADDPASIIDADFVRQSLPEYASGVGAFVVDPECYDVTYDVVFPEALAMRRDVIYDSLGRLSSIRYNLDLLVNAGFDIHMLHATAPVEDCVGRTERRALTVDGRLVSPGLVRERAEEAAEALAALRVEPRLLVGWATVDTSNMDAPNCIDGTSDWVECCARR